MTRKTTFRLPLKFALAGALATGMAASPIALSTAWADAAPGGGGAKEFVEGSPGGTQDVYENAFRILGTTPDEVMSEQHITSANTESGPLREYQHEVESGNLEGAAKALAAVSNRPITQDLVNELNLTLGLETRLTIQQLADRAADLQDPEYVTMGVLMVDPVYADFRMLNTNTRKFNEYENAMTRGNLDAAAEALAEATDRPITEELVNYVNRDLGVESTLTAHQVADAAAAKQNSY